MQNKGFAAKLATNKGNLNKLKPLNFLKKSVFLIFYFKYTDDT